MTERPPVVDRVMFQSERDELRVREKAHTRARAMRSLLPVAASRWETRGEQFRVDGRPSAQW